MSRPATSRLKVNPPLGLRPSLENCRIADLSIDPEYQRSIENGSSLTLIRKIAMFWDWSLFHPLAVARRPDGSLWVVDGQHRLAAVRLRRDMHDVPCVVTPFASRADEAASFVAMNVQRRALSAIDLFKAALVAGDDNASAVADLMAAAGLSLAPHSNHTAWKPGMVSNISGIQSAYRSFGSAPTLYAMKTLAAAFPGQILQYAGSIFMPLARCYAKFLKNPDFAMLLFSDVIAGKSQGEWVSDFLRERAEAKCNIAVAGEAVFTRAYLEALNCPAPAPPPRPQPKPQPAVAAPRPALFDDEGKVFCGQCDKRVGRQWAKACINKFCKAKIAA
jgi:ParB-like nuclease domain